MVRSIADAFDLMLSWLTPTATESQTAASHRASIEACLKNNFGITSFFRSGSFGHNTSVSGYSDVDYFAVIPTSRLKSNSYTTLCEVRTALKARFPLTDVSVRSPAAVVPFGSKASERHEITPADLISQSANPFAVYDIPDRASGWMRSSPRAHNAWVNTVNDRLDKKVKPLIRLMKAWNYHRAAGIRSFYLELRVTEYAAGENAIVYSYDVLRALRHLRNKALAAMQDPMGVSGYVYSCSDAVKAEALSKINMAIGRAEKAIEAEGEGRIAEAFGWWDLVFSGNFPKYY